MFRVVTSHEINGLDPTRSGYVFARMQVAETLTGADDGGLPVPQLARRWTLSDDRLTWRFTLRPAARFHDGSAVTAQAAVACLERARGLPGVLGPAPIAAISAEGGDVVIRTVRPFVSLPAFLAHSSALILAPASFDGTAVRAIIGSGPTAWRPCCRRSGWTWSASRAGTGRPRGSPAPRTCPWPAAKPRGAMAEGGQAELVAQLAPKRWSACAASRAWTCGCSRSPAPGW